MKHTFFVFRGEGLRMKHTFFVFRGEGLRMKHTFPCCKLRKLLRRPLNFKCRSLDRNQRLANNTCWGEFFSVCAVCFVFARYLFMSDRCGHDHRWIMLIHLQVQIFVFSDKRWNEKNEISKFWVDALTLGNWIHLSWSSLLVMHHISFLLLAWLSFSFVFFSPRLVLLQISILYVAANEMTLLNICENSTVTSSSSRNEILQKKVLQLLRWAWHYD